MFWFFVCLATRMIVMSKICIVRVSIYVFCWTAYWGFFAEGRSLYQTIICFLWFLFKANCCERAFTVDAFNHQAILAQAINNHTYQASTDHRYWLSLYFFFAVNFLPDLFYSITIIFWFFLRYYCTAFFCIVLLLLLAQDLGKQRTTRRNQHSIEGKIGITTPCSWAAVTFF